MDRVKWFRDRAARDRAREEKEILESEFERTQRSFSRMAEAWNALAKQNAPHGFRAYACRQASMYDTFNIHCRDLCIKALALRPRYLDEKPVSNVYPNIVR